MLPTSGSWPISARSCRSASGANPRLHQQCAWRRGAAQGQGLEAAQARLNGSSHGIGQRPWAPRDGPGGGTQLRSSGAARMNRFGKRKRSPSPTRGPRQSPSASRASPARGLGRPPGWGRHQNDTRGNSGIPTCPHPRSIHIPRTPHRLAGCRRSAEPWTDDRRKSLPRRRGAGKSQEAEADFTALVALDFRLAALLRCTTLVF